MSIPTATPQSSSDDGKFHIPDLDEARTAVVQEVLRAPERRLDNMISQVYDAARLLEMHAVMVSELRKRHRALTTSHWVVTSGIFGTGAAMSSALAFGAGLLEVGAGMGVASSVAAAVVHFVRGRHLSAQRDALSAEKSLDKIFREVHSVDLSEGDEFLISVWDRVRAPLRRAIDGYGIMGLSQASQSDLSGLDAIIKDVGRLRTMASPAKRV